MMDEAQRKEWLEEARECDNVVQITADSWAVLFEAILQHAALDAEVKG